MTLTDNEWMQIEAKLEEFEERHGMGMVLRDLFALGCYTYLTGEQSAGYKACDTALKALGIHQHSKGLYSKILNNLDGHEAEFTARITADPVISQILPPWP